MIDLDIKNLSSQVRLSPEALNTIVLSFSKHFASGDELWLFGSRVDLNKRGGDIDLYIETNMDNYKAIVEKKIAFVCDIKETIGDQKIDVVLNVKSLNSDLEIYKVARLEGVKLV